MKNSSEGTRQGSSCWLMVCLSLIALLHILSLPALAQVDKATITGNVADQTGAVIVGVSVTVTSGDTGARYTGESNAAGIYRVSGLPVGIYSVEYEKSGFKKLTRSGLTLATAQVAEVNVSMLPGAVTEEVQVTSAPVVLETETTDIGTDMTADAMKDLPLFINTSGVGRDITSFIYQNVPTTNGGNYIGHIAGSQNVTKNVMVDGIDATAGLQGFIQSIGMEAVQEMNVQVSGVSAEGASTGGGTIMMEMKSGTNQFHGSAYYFMDNEALNANTWDNNNLGIPRQRSRFDDWGLSSGGPIWKNHTFFFGSYERFVNNNHIATQNVATVPTQAFLNGDFSALLGGPLLDSTLGLSDNNPVLDPCGRPITIGEIYNPQNPVVSGGNTCYQPFAGNIIPTGQLSTIATKIAQNLYEKGYQPVGSSLVGNFPGYGGYYDVTSQHFDFKLDHTINEKQRISWGLNLWNYSSLANYDGLWQIGSSTGGPLSNGDVQPQRDWTVRLQHVYTMTPTILNTASVAYNSHMAGDQPPTSYNSSSIGIPGTNGANFPTISFVDVTGHPETSLGPTANDRYTPYNFVISDTVSWARGRHNFKFGGDFQARGMNALYEGGLRLYDFTSETFAPNNSLVWPFVGNAFANFMLGEVHDGSQSVTSALYGRRKRESMFASDDYKVNARLTLNLGLRWDINERFHEKNGEWSNYDITVNRGIWGAYNGGWDFAQNGSDSFERNQNFHQFGPQIGVSFQAAHNLVLRSHYGITYAPLAMNQWNGVPAFYPPGFTAGAFGFAGSNNVINNVPYVPSFSWDAAPGAYTGQTIYPARVPTQSDLSGGVAYVWPNALTMGMVQNWNFGAEYQVGKGTVFSLNYLGNHGTHLHDGTVWPGNYSTQSTYLQLYDTGNATQTVNSAASAAQYGVPFPFTGFSGLADQAITPYPQISSQAPTGLFLVNADISVSHYQAMVAEVKTSNVHGLTMDLNYTLSQATGTASTNGAFADSLSGSEFTQDPYLLPKLTHQLAAFDITHQVKGYVLYDLPVGTGQRWKTNKPVLDNYVLGGWKIGTQLSYNTGQPLGTIAAPTQYPGWSGVFAQRVASVPLSSGTFTGYNPQWVQNGEVGQDPGGQYINQSAFAQPAPGQFSTYNYSYMGFLRGPGNKDEDVNIAKLFRFGADQRYQFSLRAQFFNVFNRHEWGPPSLDMTNMTTFGQVLSVTGYRYGQLSARFEW